MKANLILAMSLVLAPCLSLGDDSKFADLEKVVYYNTVKDLVSENGPPDCLYYVGNMRNWAEFNLEQRKPHSCHAASSKVPDAILCDTRVLPYGIYHSESKSIYLYHVFKSLNANPKYDVPLPHPNKDMLFLFSLRFKLGSDKGTLSLAVLNRKYLYRDLRVPDGEPYQGYFHPPTPAFIKPECEQTYNVDIKFEDKDTSTPQANSPPQSGLQPDGTRYR